MHTFGEKDGGAHGLAEMKWGPINGTLAPGNPAARCIKPGDIVHKGEEIANIEAMKMETAVLAPYDAQVVEVSVKLNEVVKEGQLLFVLQPSEQ